MADDNSNMNVETNKTRKFGLVVKNTDGVSALERKFKEIHTARIALRNWSKRSSLPAKIVDLVTMETLS